MLIPREQHRDINTCYQGYFWCSCFYFGRENVDMAHVQLTAHVSFLLKRHFDTISTKPEGYSLVVERIPKGKEDSSKSYRCRPRPDKKKSSKSFHNDLRYPSQRETDRHLISRSVGNTCFVLMLRGILLLVCVFRATVNATAVPCCATTPQEARRGVHLPHLRR